MNESPRNPAPELPSSPISRGRFLAQAGAGLASASTLVRAVAQGTAANSRIRIGLAGCGARGQQVLDIFAAHGGFEVAGAADYFEDKVQEVAAKHQLQAGQTFTGLKCTEKMIAQGGLDAIAIFSPPFFHPGQASEAIAAGLNLYLAKPVAIDVPGCKLIRETGKIARRKGLVFLVDFQTRANEFYVEALRRVNSGAIGPVCFGEATYHTNGARPKVPPGTPEAHLRNWLLDKSYSGDIIVEQNVHTLDVMSWAMNDSPPLHCTGTGGRSVRLGSATCWDHFEALYEYPGHVGITFSSHQFDSHGTAGGIRNRMFGTKGVLETQYSGQVLIRGDVGTFYRGGSTAGIYTGGVAANVRSFHEFVTGRNASNRTIEPSVTSTLVAILGRTAAYEDRRVTWKELIASDQRIVPDLSGLKA